MKEGNKKILSVFIIMILIAATVAAVVTYAVNNLDADKEDQKEPLNVKIFANKIEGTAPLLLNFSSIVTNSEGEIEYQWDLGNGNTSVDREPSTTYELNGTYICSLSVTDRRGQKASDSINILARDNSPPSVSLVLNSNNPNRPYKLGTIKIWSKWADNFNGKKLRRVVDILPSSSSLMGMDGFVSCKAIAVDPENDEIVSYKWVLYPSPYTFMGSQVKPEYVFETNESEFTFPLLYTFGPAETKFDVTVIVTDSKGNSNYANGQFFVQKSGPETTAFLLNFYKDAFKNYIWNLLVAPSLPKSLKDSAADILWNLAEKAPLPVIETYLKIKVFMFLFGWNLLSLSDPSAIVVRFADAFTPLIEKYDQLLPIAENVLNMAENLIINLNVSFISALTLPAIQDVRELWGISNYIPDISGPNPGDGDTVYNPNYPNVSIVVTDFDEEVGDWLNVTIHGKYVQNQTWSYAKSGVFSANLTASLPANQEIFWRVEVVDHLGRTAKQTYSFYV